MFGSKESPCIKLCDFGCAKKRSNEPRYGPASGTKDWQAPEQMAADAMDGPVGGWVGPWGCCPSHSHLIPDMPLLHIRVGLHRTALSMAPSYDTLSWNDQVAVQELTPVLQGMPSGTGSELLLTLLRCVTCVRPVVPAAGRLDYCTDSWALGLLVLSLRKGQQPFWWLKQEGRLPSGVRCCPCF